MNNLDTHSKILKAYKILRTITIVFAILGPLAMICSAVVITLLEEGWWFNLFAAFLAGILMMVGTLYLSFLTLMSEITRHIRSKVRSDLSDTPITKWIHRLVMGVSIAGVVSYILILLIVYDILNGGFAIFHFACGGTIIVLYFVLGIHAVIHRKKTHLGS